MYLINGAGRLRDVCPCPQAPSPEMFSPQLPCVTRCRSTGAVHRRRYHTFIASERAPVCHHTPTPLPRALLTVTPSLPWLIRPPVSPAAAHPHSIGAAPSTTGSHRWRRSMGRFKGSPASTPQPETAKGPHPPKRPRRPRRPPVPPPLLRLEALQMVAGSRCWGRAALDGGSGLSAQMFTRRHAIAWDTQGTPPRKRPAGCRV